MSTASPEHFTSILARRLAEAMKSGMAVTEQLVAQHYESVAVACGLSPTGADALHIRDICRIIGQNSSALGEMDDATAAHRIYALIDMH